MTELEIVAAIPSAQKVIDWFGHFPTFHDAEVVSVELHRTGVSKIVVHAFNMTKAIDERGYYVNEKHAFVSFLFSEPTAIELKGFNGQNVLADIGLQLVEGNIEITFFYCYGLEGRVVVSSVELEVVPGIPDDSIYKKEQDKQENVA